jgi:type IV pilus assembly protein PilA
MRTELKLKFIQYLNQDRHKQGFTLVELLVVVIIIGILAAVALPSFLTQSAKAKQSEAKQIIGATNRVQNAYRAQNSQFASTFDQIAIGNISGNTTATTKYYNYTLNGTTDSATLLAQSRESAGKGYSGGVNRYVNSTSNLAITSTVLCEAPTPGISAPTIPVTPTGAVATCTAPYIPL